MTAVAGEKLSKLGRSIQYQEGLPENFGNAQGEPSLIILDCLLNQLYSREVCDLFTKGSHHRNISVLLLTQNFFSPRFSLQRHFNKPKISGSFEIRQRQESVSVLGAPSLSRRQPQSIRIISRRYKTAARISHIGFRPRHRRQTKGSNQCRSRRISYHHICSSK